MSFGKRGAGAPRHSSGGSRPPQPQSAASTPQPPDTSVSDEIPLLQRQLMIYGGVFVAVLAAWFLLPYLFGSLPDGPMASAFKDAEKSMTDRARNKPTDLDFAFAFPTQGVSAEIARRNVSLRTECVSRLDRSFKYEIYLYPAHIVNPVNGTLHYDYQTGAVTLGCLLTFEQARLCEPAERRAVVAALTSYLAVFRNELEKARKIEAGLSKHVIRIREQLKAPPEDGIETNSRQGSLDPVLGQAIQWATSDGYLSVADFGGRAPIEFADLFAKPLAKPCRN